MSGPPARGRAIAIMLSVGVASGLIASIPSPLPEIRLEDEGLLLNAEGVPLHAGIVFGLAVASMMWLWVTRDIAKCLLAFAVILLGWLAAVNTANDVFQAVVGSELFGTVQGAKSRREVIGLLTGGLSGAAVGAGLTAFGSGIPSERIRQPENWIRIVIVGMLVGVPPDERAKKHHRNQVLAQPFTSCTEHSFQDREKPTLSTQGTVR